MKSSCAAGKFGFVSLNTGLHPDEGDNPEGGWSAKLLPVAREVWLISFTGKFSEEELSCKRCQLGRTLR